MIGSALKWHGGKAYLAPDIVAMMPVHLHYVEPFAGGLGVLLAKDPNGVSEVVNDLNGNLTNFWSVLASEDLFPRFLRQVQAVPFSESAWRTARDVMPVPVDPTTSLDRAVGFFIYCRQSLAGRMKDFATLSRNRTRRGMNEQASAWLTAVEGLPAVHDRLKRVVILNRNAVDVIKQQDGSATLFYCDPPYLHETRVTTSDYAHEMTPLDHQHLLDVVQTCKGKVMLSGYPCDLYNRALASWSCHTFDLPNNASGSKSKPRKTEVVWCNW